MAWQTIDTLGADIPDGKQVYGYDAAGRHVIATMRHNEDGSRFWFVSPLDVEEGAIMAPAFLTHWQELPEPPARASKGSSGYLVVGDQARLAVPSGTRG